MSVVPVRKSKVDVCLRFMEYGHNVKYNFKWFYNIKTEKTNI